MPVAEALLGILIVLAEVLRCPGELYKGDTVLPRDLLDTEVRVLRALLIYPREDGHEVGDIGVVHMLAVVVTVRPLPVGFRQVDEGVHAFVALGIFALFAIIIGLLIETNEVFLGVVDGILSDDDRLPWLDRMLLPTAREVRDRLDTDILTAEVLLPCEGTLVRRVEGGGAECESVEVLDIRGGVEDRDVLVVFIPRLHGSVSPLFGEALRDDVPDVEDLLDDEVVDGGSGVRATLGRFVASTGHQPREEHQGQGEAIYISAHSCI